LGLPAGRFEQGGQHAHCRRLACPVRPKEAEDLTCVHLQIHTAHRLHWLAACPKALAEAMCLDHRRACRIGHTHLPFPRRADFSHTDQFVQKSTPKCSSLFTYYLVGICIIPRRSASCQARDYPSVGPCLLPPVSSATSITPPP